MSLSATLKSAFDSGDRSRGVAYARDGAVFDLNVEQGTINSKVGGSYGHYEVAIDLEDEVDAEGLWCTCPRFGDGFNLSLIHISEPRDKRQSRMPSSA